MSFRTTLPKVRKSDFEGWRGLRNFASSEVKMEMIVRTADVVTFSGKGH